VLIPISEEEAHSVPWIKTMTEKTASPELREVYEHIKQQRGQARADSGPPNLHSLNPTAIRHTADLMWEIMRGQSRLPQCNER